MSKRLYISPSTSVVGHETGDEVMLVMQFYTSSVYEHTVEVDFGSGSTPGFGHSGGGW